MSLAPAPTEHSTLPAEPQAEASSVSATPAENDKPTPLWAYPATYLLVVINLIVFALMCRHSPLVGYWRHLQWSEMFTSVFDTNLLLYFGASDANYVLGGQWWRLLTATFVHVTLLHLLLNMWCLWNLGVFGEPLLGRPGLIAVYLLTGIAGNLMSFTGAVLFREDSMVAGASGAVFGIAGILIILLSNKKLALPWKELRSLRMQVIFFAVVNLACGVLPRFLPYLPAGPLGFLHLNPATMPRIDNTAHLGGFAAGLALGLPLFPRMTSGKQSYRQRQKKTFAAATLALCLMAYAVFVFNAGQLL